MKHLLSIPILAIGSMMIATSADADGYCRHYRDDDHHHHHHHHHVHRYHDHGHYRQHGYAAQAYYAPPPVYRGGYAAGYSGYRSYTPIIGGAIIGGLIGNQFGKGSGKTALTAAGVVLGGSIGRDYEYSRRYR
jgi:hypothetical protein